MKKSKLAITSFVLSLMPIVIPFFGMFLAIISRLEEATSVNLGAFLYLPFIALFITWWFSVISIILGIIAILKIKKYHLGGKGLAIAGIILSAIVVVVVLVVGYVLKRWFA